MIKKLLSYIPFVKELQEENSRLTKSNEEKKVWADTQQKRIEELESENIFLAAKISEMQKAADCVLAELAETKENFFNFEKTEEILTSKYQVELDEAKIKFAIQENIISDRNTRIQKYEEQVLLFEKERQAWLETEDMKALKKRNNMQADMILKLQLEMGNLKHK